MPKNQFTGILDILDSGSVFLRSKKNGCLAGTDDVFVGRNIVRQYGLRKGDEVCGDIAAPRRGKSATLKSVLTINDLAPDKTLTRRGFQKLSASYPDEQLLLANGAPAEQKDCTNRIIDLLCPLGKGQRAMVVSPARAGKTMLIQSICRGLVRNQPDCKLYIVLVDERPEEVSDMKSCGLGEVISSSFDYPPKQHVAAAEITLERARRQVELGRDVVIILDSITRLARAYNSLDRRSGGKTLSGGLGAGALDAPKRFLGSARKITPADGGGSLTIIATALVDTGSRMDQVIFEEFKGTGNSEIVLSRDLADRRVFPAIDLNQSATRKEEFLLGGDSLEASRALRKVLASLSTMDATQKLLDLMGETPNNSALIKRVIP